MGSPALILFAHGARDPRWAEPFERVREAVARAAPGRALLLAFLDFIPPDLPTAIERHVAAGHRAIRVVPLFLGPGGHTRRDVPDLVAQARARHPGIAIDIAPSAGDDDGVIAALAACCLK